MIKKKSSLDTKFGSFNTSLLFCSVSIRKNYYRINLNNVLHDQKKRVHWTQSLVHSILTRPKIIGSVALGTSRKQVLKLFCILNFFIRQGTYLEKVLFIWIEFLYSFELCILSFQILMISGQLFGIILLNLIVYG